MRFCLSLFTKGFSNFCIWLEENGEAAERQLKNSTKFKN